MLFSLSFRLNKMQENFNNIELNEAQVNERKIDVYGSRNSFEEPAEPVTLTWQLNAYVVPKRNIFKRLKDRIRPSDQNNVKHILKDGIQYLIYIFYLIN